LIECRAGWLLPLFLWEIMIVILWFVVFWVFGKLYIGVEVSGGGSNASHLTAMHRAVWVGLVNLILWTITGAWRGLRWRRSRAAPAPADHRVWCGVSFGVTNVQIVPAAEWDNGLEWLLWDEIL
jgi:hypothetical protein